MRAGMLFWHPAAAFLLGVVCASSTGQPQDMGQGKVVLVTNSPRQQFSGRRLLHTGPEGHAPSCSNLQGSQTTPPALGVQKPTCLHTLITACMGWGLLLRSGCRGKEQPWEKMSRKRHVCASQGCCSNQGMRRGEHNTGWLVELARKKRPCLVDAVRK